MYERFTDRARKVMQLAVQEAQFLNHEYVGTEHILLGLVAEGSGVAAAVLRDMKISLAEIRAEVEKLVQPARADGAATGKLPHTPAAKRAIEAAIEEARALNFNYVGTEHLLLGLFYKPNAVAGHVLINVLGLSLDAVRQAVLAKTGKDKPAQQEQAPEVHQWTATVTGNAKMTTAERLAHHRRLLDGAAALFDAVEALPPEAKEKASIALCILLEKE